MFYLALLKKEKYHIFHAELGVLKCSVIVLNLTDQEGKFTSNGQETVNCRGKVLQIESCGVIKEGAGREIAVVVYCNLISTRILN